MEDIITPLSADFNRVGQVQGFKPSKAVSGEAEEKANKAFENQQASRKAQKEIDPNQLAEKANNRVQSFSTKIRFKYDAENHRNVIIVTDKETGEIIRQIPPEEMVSLMEKMEEIEGILFNRSV